MRTQPFDTIRPFVTASMNLEQARFNMVEQQIRTWEVLDPQVLDLLFEVKRENFVPGENRELAFADLEIPLGHGESMMQPKVEARILQELDIRPHENVYEVGSGSGYLTALMARRARHVTSVDIYPDIQARARDNLRAAGIQNVMLLEGDGARAPLAESAFDVIVIGASTPILPQAFLDRLSPSGRLFAVVGDPPVMKAVIVRQPSHGVFQHTELFETILKPLVNAAQPPRFRF
jgi:protein-L-isoaspartate(D-aspartate) O-methyltransferase